MLLLVDLTELLDCVPPSGARMLLQLINAYNPLKTLQNMASEADLAIKHVSNTHKRLVNVFIRFTLGLRVGRSFGVLGKSYNNLSPLRDKRLRYCAGCTITLSLTAC